MINILPGPKKSDPTLVEPFNAATAPLNDPTALWGVLWARIAVFRTAKPSGRGFAVGRWLGGNPISCFE